MGEKTINKREGMIICIICLIFVLIVSVLSMATMLKSLSIKLNEQYLEMSETVNGIIDDEIEIHSENKILVVVFTSSETDNVTDSTMVKNALANGGMIKLNYSLEDIDSIFETSYKKYGAQNDDGQFYTKGAIMNYVSSLGWKLIQISDSYNLETYYFGK